MNFESLGLEAELLRAVQSQAYTEPTPVQREAIPLILAGRDLLAGAQTGTGKTAAFTLPILQILSAHRHPAKSAGPRALVLAPTRELAAQVAESVRTYGQHLSLRCTVLFGGVSINPQIEQLRRGTDVVVATPGRLLDHASQKTLDLSGIEILVLDEADRMLDMGFIRDIRRLLKLLPRRRQNLLFSATFADEIRDLAKTLLNDPAQVQVTPRNATAERVEQLVYPLDKSRKREFLSHLIGRNNWQQVLVFTRTKHGANRLSRQLESDGLSSAAIHGNKSQGRANACAAGLQGRPDPRARGDRHRRARPRHRPVAARGEFRAAERTGRLRASHRSHRACRPGRPGHLARLRRGAGLSARHRAAVAPGTAPRGRAGLRGQPAAVRGCRGASASRGEAGQASWAGPPRRRQSGVR